MRSQHGDAPGHAPQGLRHLADLDLGAAARRGARLRRRPAQARARARRCGGHHRRQPPAPLCHLRRRAEPRRHRRAGLPGLGGRRDGLRARARRGEVRRRRRTRSRSTRSSPSPTGCRSCARSSTTRSAGSPATIRPTCIPSSTCRSSGREEMRAQRRRRRLVARRDRQGQGRRRQRDALYLGHHRPAQGRDADARQHRPLGRRTATSSTASRPTTRCSPICRWPGSATTSSPTARPMPAPCACACPESPETIVEDRREIGPTYFFAPPRVFENLLTQIMVRMEDAGWLKKRMFHYFLGVARRCGEQILDGKPVGAQGSPALWAGQHAASTRRCRNRMGFSRIRVAYTAGEAIGPELFRFYRSLGINLKQLYGQTEASVYITLQPDGEVYPDTVGKPGPDVEIKIADSGEVLYQEPRRVPQVLQERRGDQRHQDAGRLGAYGRCRLLRPARPPEDHRSRQGRRAASTAARCSRRSISRTASSSIPRCARRWPSARGATT